MSSQLALWIVFAGVMPVMLAPDQGVIRPDCNIHGKDELVYQKDIEDLATVISRFISAA